ncbi:Centrosomal protein of 164 kDa [Frankliniella fusca]|uniref:Centrosomal protein of 164 kDa n=1 Tax=Frankliniella fusca TaxID=407009 RepID=A0AAE1H596_9NEOP|nr:Centrosomal protein of 164 kDa [Frankliniella fusca]
MSGPSSPKSLVCEEVFDERSQPSEDEIREFAVRIGIDPDAEAHLLPLAKEGLLKPLPKNWKPVFDPKSKHYYYFNFKTKQTSWEHPLDNKFREIVKKSRSESISSAGEEDSKTSIKEELKSFEEAGASIVFEADNTPSLRDNQMDLSAGTPVLKSALSPLRSLRKENQENLSQQKGRSKPFSVKGDHLKPVFTPKPLFTQNSNESSKSLDGSKQRLTKPIWDDLSSYLDDDGDDNSDRSKGVSKDKPGGDGKHSSSFDYNFPSKDKTIETPGSSIIGRFTVDKVQKIDIDSQTKRLDSDVAYRERRSSDRFLKTGYGQPEFTLSGGGSIFLKSNKKKSEDAEASASASKLAASPNLKSDSFSDMDFKLKSLETDFKDSLTRPIKSSMRSLTASPTASTSSTRSILRTPQTEKRLWDIDPLHMSVSEKALWKQQELEEEKKSVRFNLDKELNISFKLSDSDSDTSSEPGVHVDEDMDWNSNASEDLARELQQLKKDTSKADKVGKSLVSPLEEWAKETWFSKQSQFTDKTEGDLKSGLSVLKSASITENSSPKGRQSSSQSENTTKKGVSNEQMLDETSQLASNTSWRNEEGASMFQSQHVNQERGKNGGGTLNPIKSKVNQILTSQDDFNLLDIDNKLEHSAERSSPSQSFSLDPRDPAESESSLAVSITNKLKGLSKKDVYSPENSVSKDDRAREQAFRDWNVKLTDGEMYRPPLSRQQSQQQLQQIKQQIQEPVKAVERDRALREWNVTDKIGDLSPAKDSSETIHEAEDISLITAANPVGEILEGSIEKDLYQIQNSSVLASDDFQIANRESEDKLKNEIEKSKINYDTLLKEKEKELKRKFEEDQQEMIKVYEEKLKIKIENESKSIELKFKEVVAQIERDSEITLKQLREQLEHKQNCATQKILEQHQQALAAQEVENQAAMLRFREQHSAKMKNLREQFQREEELARREQQDRLVSLREDRDGKRSKETTDHLRSIEKLRCEKRLVEDKYKTLKEKYIKLKGEMKANLEKTKDLKQKETQLLDDKPKPSQTTAIDPEASTSQQQSDRSSETESRPKTMSAGSSGTSNSLGFHKVQLQGQPQEQLNQVLDPPSPAPNGGPSGLRKNNFNESNDLNVPFLGRSFCDPPFHEQNVNPTRNCPDPPQSKWCNYAHIKTTERNGNVPSESHFHQNSQNFKHKSGEFSPLEALRHQLKTLDELEEQFPVSSVTDAYLRYPFSDQGHAGCKELESAELEFFRHRIHLERDMIRQARNSLQVQQSEYRSRVHNFQQRQSASSASPSITLNQMAKEEQELSDMEAKIRRTQTILGEKMIHLRQLENSLNQISAPSLRPEMNERRTNEVPKPRYVEQARMKQHRRWDWKNGCNVIGTEEASDEMSSDSGGSSGFSSTEYTSDNALGSLLSRSGCGQRKRTLDNSADINLSLHNLNAEISDIWNVLCRQRAAAGLGPPPLLSAQPSTWLPSPQQCTPNLSASRAGSSLPVPSIPKVSSDKSSSLIERTNNLRQWLHKAKMTATLPASVTASDRNEVSF